MKWTSIAMKRNHNNNNDSKSTSSVLLWDDWLTQTRASLLDTTHILRADNDNNDNGNNDNAVARKCPDYNDSPCDMTTGRLLARFLSQFTFYYPQQQKQTTSSANLDRAWTHYYEHVTLGRMYTQTTDNNNNNVGVNR